MSKRQPYIIHHIENQKECYTIWHGTSDEHVESEFLEEHPTSKILSIHKEE